VQPISCITSEAWQSHAAECKETVKALALHGSRLSCDEPNDYDEKHGWREVKYGGFKAQQTQPRPWAYLTPIRRARNGRSQEGAICLLSLGAKSDRGLSLGIKDAIDL
jgi:hypothetical protein